MSVSTPLQGWMEKLTRDSLTSSVSLRITPVSKPPATHIISSSTASSLFSSPLTPVSMTTKPGPSQLFSPVPYLSDLLQAKREKLQTYYEAQKQRGVTALKATMKSTQSDSVSLTTPISRDSSDQKDSVSKFSATMVQSASTLASPLATPNTDMQYSFTPPTRVLSDAHPPVLQESDPISFVFSPPLTRSAARRRHGDSQSREGSVEPTPQTQPKKHRRGRYVCACEWVVGDHESAWSVFNSD